MIYYTKAKWSPAGWVSLLDAIEDAESLTNHTGPALTQMLSELRAAGEVANPTFQISYCSLIRFYMGQPICGHAQDWAGMIKPNGPVDFYVGQRFENCTLPRTKVPIWWWAQLWEKPIKSKK
jgi:hypothetical protein